VSKPRNKDSMSNIMTVALSVCFVCSVMVASAAVFLKPQRMANKNLDRVSNILMAAGLRNIGSEEIMAEFKKFEVRLVDLEEDRFLSSLEISDLGIDLQTYDQRRASRDPEFSRQLLDEEDIASITRRARYSIVYMQRDEGAITKIILPIHGYGLWSTLYGFISLSGDMNTVSGITFYEHGETAGLGGEVDNMTWKASWNDKQIYDGQSVALRVVKGKALENSPSFKYEIDGLSGATLTSRGVENLIAFWLGEDGFGPLLKTLGS